MKNNKYKYLGLSCLVLFSSCADDKFAEFKTEKPASIAQYEYLNTYDALKAYVDRTTSPNFKLGIGVAATDFINGGLVRGLAVSNFDEMTAGNEMKYASCVRDDGSMDFSTVTKFVDAAKQAGMTIYGHTLAWHSQQNNKYLNSIIADRPVEVDPDEAKEVEDLYVDYSTLGSYSYWKPENVNVTINADGNLEVVNPTALANFWEIQYHVANGLVADPNTEYKLTAKIRATGEGSLTCCMGDWGGQVTKSLPFTTEWQEVELTFAGVKTSDGFVMFQSGNFAGTIEMEWLKVSHEETVGSVIVLDPLYQNDFSDGSHPGGWGNNSTFEVVQGVGPDGSDAMKIHNPSAVDYYAAQMAVDFSDAFVNGSIYHASFKIKGPAGGLFRSGFQITSNYSSGGDFSNVTLTGDWQEVDLTCTCKADGATRWIFSFGDIVGDIYIDDLSLSVEKSANGIPLTPEEKKDTLTWAMDNWIKGMMEATGGYVTTWDAVNEAISGADNDHDGYFDLQSAENGDASQNFYWQDYLGDEDYVRIVISKARQYFAEYGGNPSDLKLFINDYNLESWWDGNKKLKSLIHWIEKWESDGVTKIDGIGTQMHVSYILNEADQKAQEEAIVNMFKLMAETGKLVKISELDMGITERAFADGIKTENVTYEQKQKMAEFYQFIIQKYFEIIPVAQQYGITQWAATDSPSGSGWRGGEPIGLWDSNYSRKPTYGGFANGLAGKVVVEPSPEIVQGE